MSVRFNSNADDLRRASLGFGSQSAWTVTCWGQLVSNTGNFASFWTIANNATDTSGCALLQTTGSGTGLEYFDGTNGSKALLGTGAFVVGTWYFMGISMNGTSGFAKISADGSGSFTTVNITGVGANTTHNFIMFGDSTFEGEFLNGRVEAVKWWSTNLSQAEVEAEKPYRSPVRTSNVRSYWYFTASKTLDNSGNGLTLTENGTVDLEGSPTNLTDQPAQGTALNAIYNPSFETDTSGWSNGGSTNYSIDRSTTVGGKDGSAAMRIVAGAGSGTVLNPFTEWDAVGQREIPAGTQIKISYWVYIPAAVLGNIDATGVAGTEGAFTDAISFTFVNPQGGRVADTWQLYEFVTTVNPGTQLESIQTQFWTNVDLAAGTVVAYIDAVSITELAPTTFTDTMGLQDTPATTKTILRTFNDTVGLSDTTGKSVQLTRTDTAGLTDFSTQVNTPPGPMPTDTVGLSDTVTRSLQKQSTDDAGLDDDWTIVSTFNRPVTDGVGLSDGVGLAATYNRGVQESAGLTDDAIRSATYNRAADDNAGLTDDVTKSLQRTADDLLELSDEVTRVLHKTVDDPVGLSDDFDDQVTYNRFHDESVGLADDHEGVATFNRSITESTGLVDAIGRTYSKLDDDYLPIVDSFETVTTFNRTTTDTEGLSDSFTMSMTWSRSFQDSVGLTDNLTKLLSRLVQDDTGLTDEVDLDLYRLEVIQTDSVGLTDQVGIVRTRTFTKTDDTELADDVMLSLVSSRSIPDSVELTDQAVVSLASSRTVVDSAGLTDSTLVSLVHTRTITDTLALTDTHQAPVVFNRPITDSTGLRDYPSYPAAVVYNRAFSDNAGVADQITFTRGLTFTDSVPLADNVSQARTWNRLFSDLVGVTDTFTRFASYTRFITDSVGLRDLPSVKVPTQEEWDFDFGNFKKAWNFTPTVKSWGFGDLEKAWRMTMAEQIVEVAAISAEDIEVTVSAREAGVDIDPRVDPVHFAFLTPGTSPSGGTTWVAGAWGVQDQPGDLPDLYLAIGTVSGLSAGRYDIWCRVTHGAKTPMDKVGTLIVK